MPRRAGCSRSSSASSEPLPPPAADEGLVPAPPERPEPLGPRLLALLHRAVERRPLARVLGEPRPEVGVEDALERGVAARVEPLERSVPDAAEEVGEVIPAAAVKELGRRRVAEHTRRLLREDAVARERAEEAVERV